MTSVVPLPTTVEMSSEVPKLLWEGFLTPIPDARCLILKILESCPPDKGDSGGYPASDNFPLTAARRRLTVGAISRSRLLPTAR